MTKRGGTHNGQNDEEGRGDCANNVRPDARGVVEAHEGGQLALQQRAVLLVENDLEVALQHAAATAQMKVSWECSPVHGLHYWSGTGVQSGTMMHKHALMQRCSACMLEATGSWPMSQSFSSTVIQKAA